MKRSHRSARSKFAKAVAVWLTLLVVLCAPSTVAFAQQPKDQFNCEIAKSGLVTTGKRSQLFP